MSAESNAAVKRKPKIFSSTQLITHVKECKMFALSYRSKSSCRIRIWRFGQAVKNGVENRGRMTDLIRLDSARSWSRMRSADLRIFGSVPPPLASPLGSPHGRFSIMNTCKERRLVSCRTKVYTEPSFGRPSVWRSIPRMAIA